MKKRKKKKNWQEIFKNKYFYVIVFFLLLFGAYLELNHHIYLEKYFRDLFFYPTTQIKTTPFIEKGNEEIQKENMELKKLLEIKGSLAEYETIYATVIERNNAYWTNSLTINKGEKDGIKEGMAVVNDHGLIGKIEKVSYTTSIVKLVTSNDKYNQIPVRIIGEEEVNKILKSTNNKLIIEGIGKNLKIKVGDSIVTSGLTGIFPSGIFIGTITSLDRDSYDVSNTATVTLASSLENIRFVAVLKRKI